MHRAGELAVRTAHDGYDLYINGKGLRSMGSTFYRAYKDINKKRTGGSNRNSKQKKKEKDGKEQNDKDVPDYIKGDRKPKDEETIFKNEEFQKTNMWYQKARIHKKGKLYYYRDNFHIGKAAHLEVFNSAGVHLGEADPITGEIRPGTRDPSKRLRL